LQSLLKGELSMAWTRRLVVTGFGAIVLAYQWSMIAAGALEQHEVVLAVVPAPSRKSDQKRSATSFSGNISWYGRQFNGKKTASGEIFDMNKPTAAHKTLLFGTRVLVEDPRTGKSVVVRVNDRGPYARGRVMDLAREGARRLGTLGDGIVFVDCLVIGDGLRR
jgi:rare lipoprotein A